MNGRAGSGSLPASYFDAVYQASEDPWNFAASSYEAAKYADTVAALGGRRYRRALEIGCSIGVLSEQLAGHADELLAVDASPAPLAEAQRRCKALPNVTFARMQIPDELPPGRFDLVVLSEVGYYWSPGDLERSLAAIEAALLPGGDLLMVHWTPAVADYPQRGDDVHAAALGHAGASAPLVHRHGHRHETYRLDLFTRR